MIFSIEVSRNLPVRQAPRSLFASLMMGLLLRHLRLTDQVESVL
jgi:hypothetical protein